MKQQERIKNLGVPSLPQPRQHNPDNEGEDHKPARRKTSDILRPAVQNPAASPARLRAPLLEDEEKHQFSVCRLDNPRDRLPPASADRRHSTQPGPLKPRTAEGDRMPTRRKSSGILKKAAHNPATSHAGLRAPLLEDEEKHKHSMCPLDSPQLRRPSVPVDRRLHGPHVSNERLRRPAEQASVQELIALHELLAAGIPVHRKPHHALVLAPLLSPLPQRKTSRVRFKHPSAIPQSEIRTAFFLERAAGDKQPSNSDAGPSQSPSLGVSCILCACIGIVITSAVVAAHMSRSLLGNVHSPPTFGVSLPPEPTGTNVVATIQRPTFHTEAPDVWKKAGLDTDVTARGISDEGEGAYFTQGIEDNGPSLAADYDTLNRATIGAGAGSGERIGQNAGLNNGLSKAAKSSK